MSPYRVTRSQVKSPAVCCTFITQAIFSAIQHHICQPDLLSWLPEQAMFPTGTLFPSRRIRVCYLLIMVLHINGLLRKQGNSPLLNWPYGTGHKHDDVIKWKHFPRYWQFVRGIHRSPVNSTHKGKGRGALMFTLICARINEWGNNREADQRKHQSVIGLCEGNSPVTSEFPAQRASNAENVSILWRHHGMAMHTFYCGWFWKYPLPWTGLFVLSSACLHSEA